MLKKVQYIIAALLLVFVISAVYVFLGNTNSTEREFAKIIEYNEFKYTLIGLCDNSLLYFEFVGSDAVIYRRYLDTDEVIELGIAPNYAVSAGGAFVGDCYYIYITSEVDEKLVNILYEINLRDNALTAVLSDDSCDPAVTVCEFGDKLLARKGYTNSDKVYCTYIDVYDTQSGESYIALELELMNSQSSGAGLYTLPNTVFAEKKQ